MTNYKKLKNELELILSDSDECITTLSNASAILNSNIDNINWVGFYLYKGGSLYLGPFQGLPACTRISLDKGVCGYCAYNRETIVVDNVHEFKGHIACDSRSNSEICVPIVINDNLFGLLDIDSIEYSRFNLNDKEELIEVVEIIKNKLSI